MKKGSIYTGGKLAAGIFFLFLSIQATAQQCGSGYKGFAYRQTFGFGPNPGPSLPPGRTNLQYTTDPCPANGYYTITNITQGCGLNNWIPGEVCCTLPDTTICCNASLTNGYFMLVNAPLVPSIIYVDTINLCGSTDFRFTASFTNISTHSSCGGQPIRPKFTLNAETTGGQVLGTTQTEYFSEGYPNLSLDTGFTYAVCFTTPKFSGPVVIRIIDDVPGGCGNTFIFDEILVQARAPDIQAGFLNAQASSPSICTGNIPAALEGSLSPGFNLFAFQWQSDNGTGWVDIPGANSPIFDPSAIPSAGIYQYRLTAADPGNIGTTGCRVASDPVTITVRDPSANGILISNSPVCVNDTLKLSATGGLSYQWQGPAGFASPLANPSFTATRASAGPYNVFVADSFGCKSRATLFVNVIAPALAISRTENICVGDSVILQASGGIAYSWSPSNGLSDDSVSDPIAKPDQTTRFTVAVTDSNSCTDTASVLVVINTRPVISAGENKTIFKGQSTTLDGSIRNPGNVNFSWQPSSSVNDSHLLSPVASPFISTNYVLTATSGIGCGSATDTVLVTVYKDIGVPNAFSPNGDGHNDTWHIPALLAFPNALVSVYNRLGERVYESSAGYGDWDGTYRHMPQPAGTYVYIIDLGNKGPLIRGTVIIIR